MGLYRGGADRCPRCRQAVQFHAGGAICAHRDELTGEPCPTEGMSWADARQWMENIREDHERRAAASLRPGTME